MNSWQTISHPRPIKPYTTSLFYCHVFAFSKGLSHKILGLFLACMDAYRPDCEPLLVLKVLWYAPLILDSHLSFDAFYAKASWRFLESPRSSVADPNHFDMDPDLDLAFHFHTKLDPTFHFDTDLDPTIWFGHIRILTVSKRLFT